MKKAITVTLLFLILCNSLIPCACANSMEYTCGDYSYVITSNSSAEITGYFGVDQTLVIPEQLDGLTVTSIGKRAFTRCDCINVILPKGLVSIDDQAFSLCANLVGIVIPESVTHMGEDIFKSCNAGLTLYVSFDSAAEMYCLINEQAFLYDDGSAAETMLQTTVKEYNHPVAVATVRPTATPTPELTAEQKLAASLRNAQIGDVITFGMYQQDRFGVRQTPIQWIVLEKMDNSILIITESCIETMTYHKKNTSVTWETCSLREWLNSQFIEQAFSATEQNLIRTVKINNDSCGPTSDRAFLLDIDEANWYFSTDQARRSWPTAYALENGAFTNKSGCVWWWLRTTGKSKSYVAGVNGSGKLDPMGDPANMKDGKPVNGVRPAMWLNLDP